MSGTGVIVCKAAVAYAAGQPLVVEDIQVGNEIVLLVVDAMAGRTPKGRRSESQACGLRSLPYRRLHALRCSSSLVSSVMIHSTIAGSDPEGLFPSILGHEGGGIVESVGEGVTSVAPGDSSSRGGGGW